MVFPPTPPHVPIRMFCSLSFPFGLPRGIFVPGVAHPFSRETAAVTIRSSCLCSPGHLFFFFNTASYVMRPPHTSLDCFSVLFFRSGPSPPRFLVPAVEMKASPFCSPEWQVPMSLIPGFLVSASFSVMTSPPVFFVVLLNTTLAPLPP